MPAPASSTRRRAVLTVCASAALALLGACAAEPQAPAPRPSVSATVPSPTRVPETSPVASPTPTERTHTSTERPQGMPQRVTVTALGGGELVDAKLVATRLDAKGVLAPPPGVAGWYAEKGWPKPGYPGASILAGHINTRATGPDTFAKLPQVRPGARVWVTYSSGDEVEFVVTRSQALPKKVVPRDDSIWDAGNPRPLLRLITCDPTTPVKGGHYVGNWVVWAVRA